MENSQNKNSVQKRLFDQILDKIPSHFSLVDVVADLLAVSADAAYRRIRGDKTLDIAESAILVRHFGLSLDSIVGIPASGAVNYSYTPLDLHDPAAYIAYMKRLATQLESLAATTDSEITLSANDVPFFHFMPYTELTMFKLFAWTNGVYGPVGSFEEFARSFETPEMLDIFRRIAAAHRLIPSREIWTENTVGTFLKLLRYNSELGNFSDPDTVGRLVAQFLDLLESLQTQAANGNKTSEGGASFRLYLSEMDMENNFILLRDNGSMGCILKLFTINSIYITDLGFCTEALGWLDQLARRSTLISATAERERYRFFTNQQQKVRNYFSGSILKTAD